MNFFGKKTGHFDDENDFYDAPMEETEEKPAEERAALAAPSQPSAPRTPSGVGLGGASIELKVVCSFLNYEFQYGAVLRKKRGRYAAKHL